MKQYSVKFSGERAIVSFIIPQTDGEFVRKQFIAKSGAELWNGLKAFESVQELPKAKKEEIYSAITKMRESEALAIAVEAWVAAGNLIKVLPNAKDLAKLKLSEADKEAVLDLIGTLDLDVAVL